MSEVRISLISKKFCCDFSIKEKLTFIKGDSGTGKTEFTRRVSSNTSANTITVSNGFDLSVFTKDVFNNIYKRALSYKNSNKNYINKEEMKFLREYWGVKNNFPLPDNTIFIIDDEDFVKTHIFSVLFECDKSNYYIIINRSNIPSLSYSADEIYSFAANGINHTIKKYYNFEEISGDKVDIVLVEGIGSDFIFFKKLFSDRDVLNPKAFKNINSGGKDNLINAIKNNISYFYNRNILLVIDFCGFGSNIEYLVNLVKDNNLKVVIMSKYLSFEYLILKSNFIKDDIDTIISMDRLKFYSLEDLCTQRLISLTKGTIYHYSKSGTGFSPCYYLDCCSNTKNDGSCNLRRSAVARNKIVNMVVNTDFQYLLKL